MVALFLFKESEDNESIIENAGRMGIKLLDVLNNAVGILDDENKRIKKEMSSNGN
ncbi:phage holin family protein [Bacillus cereus]|uniref:phage holin family protein n=1 Tax=Bacillus cereus TaxID=1396 RepID=UPI0011453466|nr:phage holin family protein [Bacillus cereus]